MVVEDAQPSEQVIDKKQVANCWINSINDCCDCIWREGTRETETEFDTYFPESASTEVSIRKNEDTQNVTLLISKYVGVDAHINNVTWIGKQTEGPRLMKVTLLTREEKIRILHNRFNLRNKEHPTHINKVFITPDLTPQQQAENKQLAMCH